MCSGKLSDRPPLGAYTAYDVPTPWHGSVSYVELKFYSPAESGVPYPDVSYQLNVVGCLYKFLDGIFQHDCTGDPKQLNPIMNFTGHFHDDSAGKGSVLVPITHPGRDGQPTWIEEGINKLFGQNIHWCPGQNQFVLKVIGVGELSKPYCKLTQPTSMYATVSPHGTSE